MAIYNQKKSVVYAPLIVGIPCLLFGMGTIFFWEEHFYVFALYGVWLITSFFINYKNRFVEITDEKIKFGTSPKKEIKIEELEVVKFYAGDYIFKSVDKKVVFPIGVIPKNYREDFILEFERFKSRWEATRELKEQ